MSQPEIFCSLDIETDGPMQGINSMLSLGAASFNETGECIGTFQANLEPLPGQIQDPVTMSEFWSKNPDAWAKATANAEPPQIVMGRFDSWLQAHDQSCRLVPVGYPIAFDLPWIRWYTLHCRFPDRLGFQGIDVRSFAMARLGRAYGDTSMKKLPPQWLEGLGKNTHVASEDAYEQGTLFMRMMLRAANR